MTTCADEIDSLGEQHNPKRLFVVAGEHSGDHLGAALLKSLLEIYPEPIEITGVYGEEIEKLGSKSVFPLADVAIMGVFAIAAQLPRLINRVYRTVDAALKADPDLVLIIDSPEFTHAVAKRIRKKKPDIPIIDYVCPSVWAWRSYRAKRMTRYVDHVLALLPFEPHEVEKLEGPVTTYVGHPLIAKYQEVIDSVDNHPISNNGFKSKILVVLPGSRRSEIKRLMKPFGDAVSRIKSEFVDLKVVLPTLPSVRALVEEHLKTWEHQPVVVVGNEAKWQAFQNADAALAASGTVSLELAICKVPMIIAYRVDWLVASLRWTLRAHSVVLPNLILGRNVIPEYIHETCTPDKLSMAVIDILRNEEAAVQQRAAFEEIKLKLLGEDINPAEKACEVVMKYLNGK